MDIATNISTHANKKIIGMPEMLRALNRFGRPMIGMATSEQIRRDDKRQKELELKRAGKAIAKAQAAADEDDEGSEYEP